jgi:hypothetical protein
MRGNVLKVLIRGDGVMVQSTNTIEVLLDEYFLFRAPLKFVNHGFGSISPHISSILRSVKNRNILNA